MNKTTSMAGSSGNMTFRRSKTRISDKIIPFFLGICAVLTVFTTIGIVYTLLQESILFFKEVPIWDFLTGTVWSPILSPQQFGVLPLLGGTLLITGIAIIFAVPIGLASAIYLNEYAPARVRGIVKPVLEILAGVPTIVYGYFALETITPMLQKIFPDMGLFNALSAGIVVGIMVLPMISSLSEDAMRAVPKSLRHGAYALGATRFEVALKIVLPAAISGVVSSFVLAFSRAIGETMIVTVAAGATPRLTLNPLESIQTMTSYIVQVTSGDVPRGTLEYGTIFAVGLTLFVITFFLNILAQWVARRFREEY
ncbi:phosphate ABC transporter permease subunit PstC [Paenibacillus faecalis]|uniref:phosphate ABC transporter permease subunit PstC n=1 Tax=Paenibacillus faecalis TaxID=2079532 RepID=UPI000D0ED4B5|nr:phosphate ABC transporter permease subunit PstC [Paenibacillus faecalis]